MNNHFKRGFATLLLLVMASALASAAPGVPHQFYGAVTVNGQPAPDNYLVEAVVNSVAKQTFTADGAYGYDDVFYVEDPNNDRLGDTITFYVGADSAHMVKATTATFQNGASTRLDLSVKTSTTTSTTTTRTTGGGGGGSTFVPTTTPVEENDSTTVNETSLSAPEADADSCSPDWICTSWGECINGQQSRTCADVNSCGVEDGKPAQKQQCALSNEELYGSAPDEKPSAFNRLTGAVTGGGVGTWGTLIGLLLVIGGIIVYARTRKN